ncbi:Spy/CpxP family protein refolding chaperone [Biformimicrobium ophioploci]|uniref:Periplasmic heavy metal sensor n=1 Tax=Biformimicrobium ophioploci TaxID=3036711 RepID=A0ABQ6LZH0_9GAMM|nr:Spy/CpxP family protein refolding chaperone [Microbulbifer sp. NKW57]GMG87493.1 hypothetical protein MNKW57_18140 [Microbulbifer sp. NKW57]
MLNQTLPRNFSLFAMLAILMTAVSFSAHAVARDHARHHGSWGEHRLEKMAKELQLTEEQQAKIKAQREAARAQCKERHERISEIREEIGTLLEGGGEDSKLDALGAEMGRLKVQCMKTHHDSFKAMREMLTDEQKAKLDEMKAERKEKGKERRKHRHMHQKDKSAS